ncbi:MAG TPA: flagellar biosynthesis protein FlhF [Acetivibrio sp.]|jgi:flagellar biosynthesis protein FlhF|nr:flagellar biosynthesis protein FlhF [Clostridium sp.]HOQ37727.1 flagellar biosynthesis protein FlhF [Acetivibrio sp.]HPT91460.1 flagellar biosynthesis protein FlhF [Acetivibrio sp.]
MKIRRYIGKDAQEAILKVRMDLGNDALILNTRKVRQKGFLKMFSKPLVEILAAVDEYYGPTNKKVAAKNEIGFEKKNELKTINGFGKESIYKSKLDEKEEKIVLLENKINGMEAVLNKIYNQIQQPAEKTETAQSKEEEKSLSGILQLFYNNLVKNEVETDIVQFLIERVHEKKKENAGVNDTTSILYSLISELLGKPSTIKLREDGKPTVIVLVGPTGVGKTTTLAKIAAHYALDHKKNVGLITADTYRIAAVEQLKTYAEILGMPLKVVYSADEISEALEGYKDKDIVFIDTAGRSYKNKPQFEELKTFVEASCADEVFLVLSTTTGMKNCREIIENYSFLQDYKLIFTKLDESSSPGVILNSRYRTQKELSFVTMGQSVPDDIEIANVDKITKNLLGAMVYDRSS